MSGVPSRSFWRDWLSETWTHSREQFRWWHPCGVALVGFAFQAYREDWVNAAVSLVENVQTAGAAVAGWAVLVLLWHGLGSIPRIYRSRVSEIDALVREREKQRVNDLNVEIGGYYADAGGPNHTMPGTWFVIHDVAITNRTNNQLPLEISITVGMRADGSWRMSNSCATVFPAWAVKDAEEHELPHGRFLNIPALHAKSGFCIANFGDIVSLAGVSGLEVIVREHPVWVEIKNKLTDESYIFPVNRVANRLSLEEVRSSRRKE